MIEFFEAGGHSVPFDWPPGILLPSTVGSVLAWDWKAEKWRRGTLVPKGDEGIVLAAGTPIYRVLLKHLDTCPHADKIRAAARKRKHRPTSRDDWHQNVEQERRGRQPGARVCFDG